MDAVLTSRGSRSLLFLIAFLLAAQAALAPEGAADLFAWVGEGGVMALRAAGTRERLGWTRRARSPERIVMMLKNTTGG